MSELEDICREAAALRARKVPFFLATVARVSGSAYRRPGARMLIAEDRWLAGSLSGGCLERDLLLRGAFRMREGAPVLVTYESTSGDDVREALGLGCNGVVEVLLERIDDRTELDPTRFVQACFSEEEVGALATVFASEVAAVPVGSRIAARRGRIVASTLPEGPTKWALARDALAALADGSHGGHVLALGRITALIERFAPPLHLFVIGSRHDALPLVTLARAMGLHVTLADASASASTRARFAGADQVVIGPAPEIARAVDERARAAVIVMTHDYERDKDYLGAILPTRARYVGVLGPRARTLRMLAEIGAELTEDVRARLHAPVGLDLGADTPQEIALAILAEVHAAMAGASAVPLRDRAGPIHAHAPRTSFERAAE